MNAFVSKASQWGWSTSVQLNSMSDLKDFIEKNGTIIVNESDPNIDGKGYDLHITIYDDYIE